MFTLGSDIPCWWPRLARRAAPETVPVAGGGHGVRRGELCGLQIRDIDLDRGLVHVAFNYVVRGGQRVRKDTKTHQDRWLAIDPDTVQVAAPRGQVAPPPGPSGATSSMPPEPCTSTTPASPAR
jgi:hypothetical protein